LGMPPRSLLIVSFPLNSKQGTLRLACHDSSLFAGANQSLAREADCTPPGPLPETFPRKRNLKQSLKSANTCSSVAEEEITSGTDTLK
jgi:hypothetical protein